MAQTSAKQQDIKGKSFEEALKELETIVTRLERGDVQLEESVAIYERGEAQPEAISKQLHDYQI